MIAPGLRWDLFCRVVDNLGDAGICWRLARQLTAEYAQQVTLWIDQPEALSRMEPGLVAGELRDGVRVRHWKEAESADWLQTDIADVVIAAFAAELPANVRAALGATRPVWINLEYLSAEDWVAGSHGLPSPKPDGRVEHFYLPGFTDDTGGLLREADLLDSRDRFIADPTAVRDWLAGLGVDPEPGERLMSLFCYPDAPTDALLEALAASGGRWRVLLPEGVLPALSAPDSRNIFVHRIPFLPQRDYDRLLWACDANLVRGEDSMVRALWAGRPSLWQAYPQGDSAHLTKLAAYLDRYAADASLGGLALQAPLTSQASLAFRQAHLAWNGGTCTTPTATAIAAWIAALPALDEAARRWSAAHAGQGDLASRLAGFVCKRL